MARKVKITKDGTVSEVNESSASVWERHGWTVTDDGDEEKTSSAPPATKKTAAKKSSEE